MNDLGMHVLVKQDHHVGVGDNQEISHLRKTRAIYGHFAVIVAGQDCRKERIPTTAAGNDPHLNAAKLQTGAGAATV